MLLIDTNIFLEYLLNQRHADEVEAFLIHIQSANVPTVCSHFAIHAIEAILSGANKYDAIGQFLKNMERNPSISIYATSITEEMEISRMAQEKKLDFDDALQYYVAKKTGCYAIISFDTDFDHTDLMRKTPQSITPLKH